MKTKNYILHLFIAILAVFAVSCGDEEGLHKDKEKEKGENNPSGRYSIIVSAGRSQAKGDRSDTRATLDLDTYIYRWDVGDRVVMSVTPFGESSIVDGFDGIELLAMNMDTARYTTFLAELGQEQFVNLVGDGPHFDFYSYFPARDDIKNEINDDLFPASLQFVMPASYTLVPNTFVEAKYAPMVAIAEDIEPEISYPEEDGDQSYCQLGGIDFEYKHILSYAAIDMDVRLLPDPVTAIKMKVDGPDNIINGTMTYDISSGGYSFENGSDSVTINITDDGLTVGSDQLLYIPMPVKDLSGHTFTFTFTTANTKKYAYKTLTTTSGVNFERGKIHRIHVAPAAEYKEGTSFEVTQSGLYYIEAWGGDGGAGASGGAAGGTAGVSNRIAGLYQLTVGQTVFLYVGSAGITHTGTGTGTVAGGSNGCSYGKGGEGGGGGPSGATYNPGRKGGSGGAGTFVFFNGTSDSNIRLVSGGGGGGGGANNAETDIAGGAGGNGGTENRNGSDGKRGGNGNHSGNGGNGSGVGGDGGSAGAPGGSSDSNGNGGYGATGNTGTIWSASGSGAGGGGGGWNGSNTNLNGGGGGGEGGHRSTSTSAANRAGGGGGGAGGASYLTGTADSPGISLPTPAKRPSTNGYVVITPIRQR